jgi:hypothetical protein
MEHFSCMACTYLRLVSDGLEEDMDAQGALTRGVITKVLESFGFIESDDSHLNVFFHKTQVLPDCAKDIAVGGLQAAIGTHHHHFIAARVEFHLDRDRKSSDKYIGSAVRVIAPPPSLAEVRLCLSIARSVLICI